MESYSKLKQNMEDKVCQITKHMNELDPSIKVYPHIKQLDDDVVYTHIFFAKYPINQAGEVDTSSKERRYISQLELLDGDPKSIARTVVSYINTTCYKGDNNEQN